MRTQIRRLYNWSKDKTVNFLKWIWRECKDWHTVALLLAVIILVYSPVWMGYILLWVFDWSWAGIVATAMLAFWAGPFSPFFVLCISITLGIKRLFDKKGKFSNSHPDKSKFEIKDGTASADVDIEKEANTQK